MTLALTRFRAHGIRLEGPSQKRGLQRMVFQFTAAATDVTLDLGDFSGTFWSAVDDSALGASVKDLVQNRIIPQCAALLRVCSPQLIDRQQVGTAGRSEVVVINSAASAGGSATEAYTVTGLLTTDSILSVEQYVDGAGAAVGILSWGSATGQAAANNALSVVYNADPGAGAKVRVTVLRATTQNYAVAVQNSMPNITLPTADGETSWTVEVIHELNDRVEPVFAEYGSDT